MLKAAFAFLLIAIIAGLFGFGGIASASMGIAKLIFFVALFLFVLAIAAGVGLFNALTGQS